MKFGFAHILAFLVLLFHMIADMLRKALKAVTGLLSVVGYIVSSARNPFSPVDEYPVGGASQSRPHIQKRRRASRRSPGIIGRINNLLGLTSIVSQVLNGVNRCPSFTACLVWISRPILHCLWFLAITIHNLVGTCIKKAREWNPFNYFALLRQLKAAQREARLLEEGLYQTTVEIKNLKARYKVKEQENSELRRRVEEVEEDCNMGVEDLKALFKERTNQEKTLEEEKQALVEEMETLRKEKDVETEVLRMEKDAEIATLKEESWVIEEQNANQMAALNKENEALREEKAAVETENEILKDENTKIQTRVEELEVEVKMAQDKAKVASLQVVGMEIAQKKERKMMKEVESMVVIIQEELNVTEQDLDRELKGREAERVAMELERATFEENMRKLQEGHRQEINAFVVQLQGDWNRALDLNSQLDVANQQNIALQDRLKEVQDSLATIAEEKKTLGLGNRDLEKEVFRLREVVGAMPKKKEHEEKEGSGEKKEVDLEALKRNFESRDRIRRDIPGNDETTIAEDSSVMDGENTVLEIITDRFDTPGRKKQSSKEKKAPSNALLVATKDNLTIGADTPVVRLPAAGTTRVLPPIQGDSVDTYVPPVDATSIIPLSFDPAPIQVRLPPAPKAPISKDTQGDSRSSRPVKSKESASSHPKKLKWRRGQGQDQGDARNGGFNPTSRSPLGSITNQSLRKHSDKGTRKWVKRVSS